jgi:hypothetical protein
MDQAIIGSVRQPDKHIYEKPVFLEPGHNASRERLTQGRPSVLLR